MLTVEDQKLIDAFAEFKKAADNLNRQWDVYTHDKDNVGATFSADYPFPNSFDEVAAYIELWANASINVIKFQSESKS